MTRAHLAPRAARRVFLLLTVTRWFPVGLTVGILVLYQLDRGQSVPEVLIVSAIAGLVVLMLELPTSGFADGFGRRPVYVASAVVSVAASCVYLVAESFWTFAVGAGLMGLFRALDSGPLEAWYVDTVHLSDPGADVDQALARVGAVMGGSVGVGAVISGGLVWWHPIHTMSALTLPVLVFAVLNAVHLFAVMGLMHEPRDHRPGSLRRSDSALRALGSARATPGVVREGLGHLRTSQVLRGLVLVEVFWVIAMVVFEQFQQIRLAELLGDQERAGAWMGPVAAAGWGVFALGSAVGGVASRHIGVARTAICARALNGLGAVAMGLVTGPVALVLAYLTTYSLHGGTGPVHSALLHREASAHNRATLLSINSMAGSAAFVVAAPVLALLADRTSTQTAMVIAGIVSALGAAGYLPALRRERRPPAQ